MSTTLEKRADPVGTHWYMKKPRAVRAVQFNPRARSWPPNVFQFGHASYVTTANGDVEIKEGTWICWQKVAGKFDVWPVAPEIFERTYERAVGVK